MFKKFRADWKASGEALDRNTAVRARRKAREAESAQSDNVGTVIANAATIAGNDANSAAGDDCS